MEDLYQLTTNLRIVVEKPRPSDLLLVSTTQSVSPLMCCVPAAFSLHDVAHFYDGQNIEKILICSSTCVFRYLIRDTVASLLQKTYELPYPLLNVDK
jgi:hypothetical protein